MRVWVCAVSAGAAVVLAGAAWAQENLEQGKSGAQLFATDCSICHKSPQALVKDGYPTEAFLRVHYASSHEMAAAVYSYLRGIARPEGGESRSNRAKTTTKKNSGATAAGANAPEKKSDKKD